MAKLLEDKFKNIEVEKVQLEEEFKASLEKYEYTVAHLHAKISTLEDTLEETEVDLKDRNYKILFLEKDTKTKNEIIQNINSGFI